MSEAKSESAQTSTKTARQVLLEITEVVLITEKTIVKYLSIVINRRCNTVDIDRNLRPKSMAIQILMVLARELQIIISGTA